MSGYLVNEFSPLMSIASTGEYETPNSIKGFEVELGEIIDLNSINDIFDINNMIHINTNSAINQNTNNTKTYTINSSSRDALKTNHYSKDITKFVDTSRDALQTNHNSNDITKFVDISRAPVHKSNDNMTNTTDEESNSIDANISEKVSKKSKNKKTRFTSRAHTADQNLNNFDNATDDNLTTKTDSATHSSNTLGPATISNSVSN